MSLSPDLVDEAVDAWHGALRSFALLQPQGLFSEG